MPERGRLAHKSIGLAIVDKVGDYWEVIQGKIPIDREQRKLIF
jgi:hypothetical protein